MKATANGLSQLMKCHLQYQQALRLDPPLTINSIDIMNAKCNNKHVLIHTIIYGKLFPKVNSSGKRYSQVSI